LETAKSSSTKSRKRFASATRSGEPPRFNLRFVVNGAILMAGVVFYSRHFLFAVIPFKLGGL
jgi:hypothetical protein